MPSAQTGHVGTGRMVDDRSEIVYWLLRISLENRITNTRFVSRELGVSERWLMLDSVGLRQEYIELHFIVYFLYDCSFPC